ncbi:Heat-labile enterotoxin, A chain [Metarhizium album ARSEF 1941]|uniref:Heat-labile enterotoxin, A chain n=1 Tax=Metarhizium album (strain ARSEF 1941) TaxID=1081103 RepID=A0A0B2WMA5_METAS|nr:Heat-labile enterotoxin, A chain [Metarhizium album ARSEF 1941]KHN94779.1 Heat-labile enterotoxin, A chain [Metarhizium album ARSEF 1941]
MHSSSFFVLLGIVASLVSGVVASTLYRGDSRGPKTIKDAGGFKAKGFNNPEGTLFEHVEGTLKHPSRDPFISTSNDIEVSKKHAGNGYLYTLDSTKIHQKIHDVAAEYAQAKKKYGHADEKEFSVEHLIPWDAVTKVQKKKDGEWKTIKMPTKRMPEFPDGDVFAA